MTTCPKCQGTGGYAYDHNHSTVCEQCCDHAQGWFLLSDHYMDAGKWCCKAGCGTVRDDNPDKVVEIDI